MDHFKDLTTEKIGDVQTEMKEKVSELSKFNDSINRRLD